MDYSTYLGAGTGDLAVAVAVDGSGQAYVTGATKNPAFPTKNPLQATCGSDGTCNGGLYDIFVTVFNAAGNEYVYSTFLGGERSDEGFAIAVDSSKNAYITGLTSSTAFPTKTPIQGTFGGGSLPTDAFVTEINAAGSLVYSTYLGGSGNDTGVGIAVDNNKNAYVTGQTSSTNFPTVSPTQATLKGQNDAFITEVNAAGSAIVFSTYLGGSLNEDTTVASGGGAIGAIAVDGAGANIYVAGNTVSTDFPIVAPVQGTAGASGDAFVAKYSTGASSANFTITNGALSPTSGHAGVSANATVTVTSTAGFSAAVALTCSVSPAVTKGPTCSLSPASVTPPANSTATSTLTVSTTAAAARLENPFDGRGVIFLQRFFRCSGSRCLALE